MVKFVDTSHINLKYHLLHNFEAAAERGIFLVHPFAYIMKFLLFKTFVSAFFNNLNELNWNFRFTIFEIIKNVTVDEFNKSRTINPMVY